MLICGVFLIRIGKPRSGVFSGYLARHPGGWADRLRYLWYVSFFIGPFALCGLSLAGFHYTAQRLAMLLHTNAMTLVSLLMLFLMLERWLLLSRRKIMIAQARQRLEDALRRNPASEAITSAVDSQLDLAEVNAQTRRLVSSLIVFAAIVAGAFIWSGVLPAVNVLNAVELWNVQGNLPNERVPITLADLLMAIPIVVMTIVFARNVPGLLEIALLQYLPLENAVRYAISTLCRYAILLLGLVLTLRTGGVHWVNVQWLVAALGVGLGFGLQEIFANFVSGIILLFEQPVRVGDVITIGDLTGSVAKIRMRATTITDWDRKELIIPNKDLVTGRLLNWTLSDTTNRIVIPVSIAYGADTEKACNLLREICEAHPDILHDPPPTAMFEGFGDGTYNLMIRAFLASLETRIQTRHDLLTRIASRFAEERISISFPQRELHLKSVPESLARLMRDPTPSFTSKAG
jgi:potassium efflux system protein